GISGAFAFTMISGSPPLEDTLRMPLGGSEKTMSFPSQLTPHGLPDLQIVMGAPPVVAIFFNAESGLDQKPTHCPSGEKNGFDAPPLVPAIGRASISDICRK